MSVSEDKDSVVEDRQFESDVRAILLELDIVRSDVIAGRRTASSSDMGREGKLVQHLAELIRNVAEDCGPDAQALIAAGVIARWIFDDAARVFSESRNIRNAAGEGKALVVKGARGLSFGSLGFVGSGDGDGGVPPKS